MHGRMRSSWKSADKREECGGGGGGGELDGMLLVPRTRNRNGKKGGEEV